MSTPVEISTRTTMPEPSTDADALRTKALSAARLGRFMAQLAVKERLKPDLHVRPLAAELFLTDNCNLTCVSCNCWREHTRDELSTGEWRDVIDQLAALGFIKLNFTGGEALIRRDASSLIRHAHDAGIVDLHLNTNGIVLDRQRLAEVIAAGIRSFNVSIDGPTAESHDAIRGRDGAFDITVDAIRRIVEQRERHGLSIQMNFTVLADNAALLPDMARLAQELDVGLYLNLGTDTTFLFRHAEVTSLLDVDEGELRRALEEIQAMAVADPGRLPSQAALRYIPSHFGFEPAPPVPCVESQLKLMVHSTGGVGGCWGHDPTMSVREMAIADIIDSDHYRDEHERLFRKDCVKCGSNYALNLRTRPSTIAETALGAIRSRR